MVSRFKIQTIWHQTYFWSFQIITCSVLGSPLYVIFNYLEPLHGFPISSRVWIIWSALEQDAGSAIDEGAVDDVRVSGDPADVGNAAKDVVLKLKHIYSGGWNT